MQCAGCFICIISSYPFVIRKNFYYYVVPKLLELIQIIHMEHIGPKQPTKRYSHLAIFQHIVWVLGKHVVPVCGPVLAPSEHSVRTTANNSTLHRSPPRNVSQFQRRQFLSLRKPPKVPLLVSVEAGMELWPLLPDTWYFWDELWVNSTPNSLTPSWTQTSYLQMKSLVYFSVQLPGLQVQQWEPPLCTHFFVVFLISNKAQAPWAFFPLELRDPPCNGGKLEPYPEAEFAWPPYHGTLLRHQMYFHFLLTKSSR